MIAMIRGKLLLHRVVMHSWSVIHLLLHVVRVVHLLLHVVGVMHLLLHVVIIVSVIASRGISRIFKTIMLHWFPRNVVTHLVRLRRFLNRRDNILEHFVFD